MSHRRRINQLRGRRAYLKRYYSEMFLVLGRSRFVRICDARYSRAWVNLVSETP